jgi:adenine-specific DNA-methyltransferase
VTEPYYQDELCTIYNADTLAVMRALPDNSIDLIATDPPYFKVKGEAWDNQWDKPEKFLAWVGQLCDEWQRLLKPNGSLYCFASPQMTWGVEGEIRKRFNVMNRIRWVKEAGWHNKAEKETLRAFLSPYEEIIFAEHYGADNIAKGEAGYLAKCDELRGFVFEPLRAYLDGERERAGITVRQVAEAFQQKSGSRTVTGMAGHWFSSVQWTLPTAENYQWLRALFAGDYLRREYEDLRREYEDLRRPFNVTAAVPYTDVWDFPTVQAFKAKHVCEKPIALMKHILSCSGKPGLTVFDGFIGSGTTLRAAKDLQMKAIGCDLSARDCETAANRLRQQAFSFEAAS